MGEFPAGLFRMPGDPGSIRSSAGRWSAFGTAATQAGGQILALDTTTFIGPEGDQFRDGLTDEMPEQLRITGDAFGRVAGALNAFATTLAVLQDQMRPLATRAPGLWTRDAGRGATRPSRTRPGPLRRPRPRPRSRRPPTRPDPDTRHLPVPGRHRQQHALGGRTSLAGLRHRRHHAPNQHGHPGLSILSKATS